MTRHVVVDAVLPLFQQQVEETLREVGDLDGRARPILEEIARLSAEVFASRASGEIWEAAEATLDSAHGRLELAGMLAIRNAWRRRVQAVLSGLAQALIRVPIPSA